MKLVLSLLLSLLLAANAVAAQRFSFAGLSWGDSYQEVERKIVAAKYGPLTSDRAFPDKTLEMRLIRRMKGVLAGHSFDGMVVLHDGRLTQVQLTFELTVGQTGVEYRDIESLLSMRYGKPRNLGAPNYEHQWSSSSGEILELSLIKIGRPLGGADIAHVVYNSPTAMRLVREAKAIYESEQRRKASEVLDEKRRQASKL